MTTDAQLPCRYNLGDTRLEMVDSDFVIRPLQTTTKTNQMKIAAG
jgi:hypothetical protein